MSSLCGGWEDFSSFRTLDEKRLEDPAQKTSYWERLGLDTTEIKEKITCVLGVLETRSIPPVLTSGKGRVECWGAQRPHRITPSTSTHHPFQRVVFDKEASLLEKKIIGTRKEIRQTRKKITKIREKFE